MRKNTVKVLQNQTLFDIAIQEYGTIEAVFILLEDNPILTGITDEPLAGTILSLRQDRLDKDMVSFYKVNTLQPANGINSQRIVGPPLFPEGDFNDDFNLDFFI